MHQKIVFAAIVIACSLPVATAPATFPQTPAEIDVSLGHINGKVALSLWPAKGLEDQRLIDPSGFEAHLAKEEDLDEELIFPCGTWFQPPPGRYKFWLEGRGSISPFSSVLHFAGGPFKTQGLAGVTPVVPGGVVALSHEGRLKGDIALRLLHIDSHNSAPKIRREMSRRLIGDAMSQGALMPEGLVLAALFDKSSNEYLAISRPVQVSRRATTWVRPQPPKANTDLLVVLDRPILLTDRARYDVEPVLVGLTGSEKRPDVTVPTPERLYAIWYDLQGKYATLRVESERFFLESQDIVLRSGKVEYFYAQLKDLPDLTVHIQLPSELLSEPATLEVLRSQPPRDVVLRAELGREIESHVFESAPALSLYVALDVPPWDFWEEVDLTDGEDQTVTFQPVPIQVSGTVYRGETGFPATVSFRTSGKDRLYTVETDESGAYEGILFHSGFYMTYVHLMGATGPPYLDHRIVPDATSTSIDFHIPANVYRVQVVDAETGVGISGAKVGADNRFSNGEQTASQRTLANDDGIAELQPLRPGVVLIQATAEGYFPSDPITEDVFDDIEEREIKVTLHPVKRQTKLRILLPGAMAAPNASVRAQHSLDNSLPFWEGSTDTDGLVEVPGEAEGKFLLIRHPEAGFLIRRWPVPSGSASEEIWTLPVAASPFALQVNCSWGDPAPFALLALFVDNLRITGRTLAWLTGTPVGGTDAQGFWQAHNLPAASFEILAWMQSEHASFLAGRLDSFVVPVAYPWQDIVEIEAFG